MSAKNKIGQRTTPEVLEHHLLKGAVFSDVMHIDTDGLLQLLEILKTGQSGFEYTPAFSSIGKDESASAIESLKDQRRKKEIAIRRLKSLFLYSEEEMPEKDFILEHKKLVDEMESIDNQLSSLTENQMEQFSSDEAFIEKSSYFIMVESLHTADSDDPSSFIRSIDTSVVKTFMNTILTKIIIADGKPSEIRFKNGLTLRFTYR